MAKSKNKIAYDGLKSIGHNWTNDPYDSKLYYEEEWEENKHLATSDPHPKYTIDQQVVIERIKDEVPILVRVRYVGRKYVTTDMRHKFDIETGLHINGQYSALFRIFTSLQDREAYHRKTKKVMEIKDIVADTLRPDNITEENLDKMLNLLNS